ncbi:hypothetical protein [Azospirillum largimobile]
MSCTTYPLCQINATTLAGIVGTANLAVDMIAVDTDVVTVNWPQPIYHHTREAIACLALTALDPDAARLRFPTDDFNLGWLIDKVTCLDVREQKVVADMAGIAGPNGLWDTMRPIFSAGVRSVIEAHHLDALWRRTGPTRCHLDLRPIDPDRYEAELLKLDTIGRISGLMLLGLYNATMMRVIAKRQLRFGAVEALVSLQAQEQSGWTDTMTLLSHYPGW